MNKPDELNDVSCLVIHHNRFPGVLETISSINREGVPFNQILVVDNSDDDAMRSSLGKMVNRGIDVYFIPNRGYANAVNAGVRRLSETGKMGQFTLVSTHETIPYAGSIRALRDCLSVSSQAIAAGPTLLHETNGTLKIWSTGGFLSRFLKLPGHHSWGEFPASRSPMSTVAERDYLDGAFCLYKSEWLEQHSLPEQYFLYFEETDYHAEARSRGKTVLWCPDAQALQSSNGVPGYYLGRNLQLFMDSYGNRFQRTVSAPTLILKYYCKRALRRNEAIEPLSAILRGWWSAHAKSSPNGAISQDAEFDNYAR